MGANLLSNPGFENRTGDNFDNWTEATGGTATITAETTDVFRGSTSIKFSPDGVANCYIAQTNLCEVGQEYTITFWAKGVGGSSQCYCSQPFNSGAIYLTSEWKKYMVTGIATATGFLLSRQSNDTPFLVDKVKLEATPVKFAVKRVALSDDIASPDTDVTETDFGTVKAAIVMVTNVPNGSGSNSHNIFSVGFWDGTSQRVVWAGGANAAAQSATNRGIVNSRIAYAKTTSLWAEYSISNITNGVRITMEYDGTSIGRYATVILIGGADVEAEVSLHRIPANTTTTTRDVSIDFRPDLLLMASTGATVTTENGGKMAFGAVSRYDLANRAIYFNDINAQETTNCACRTTASYCTAQMDGGDVPWECSATKFTSNGYILTMSGSSLNDEDILVLALKIPGVQIKLDTLTGASSTGNDSITGVGFKPGFLMIANTIATSLDTHTDGISYGVGAGTSSSESFSGVTSEDNVDTSDTTSVCVAKVLSLRNVDGTTSEYSVATIDSFDNDGFTLNYTTADAVTKGWYLAIADVSSGQHKRIIRYT